jgi:outer membrane protein assembly factor BamB
MRPRRPAWSLVLSLGALLATPAAALAGSTSFQGDPAHDGSVADSALRPPLTKAWTRELDGSPGFPLAADGRVFAIAAQTLYAFDRATGATLWRRPVPADEDQLAYDGGRLFVTSGELAQAIDPATGDALWRVRATANGFASVPIATAGRVYTMAGSALRAMSGADGATLWQVSADYAQGLPAAAGDRVVTSSAKLAIGFDLAGARKWQTPTDDYGDDGISVLHAGRVWTNHGEVRDAATGAMLREYRSD